MINGLVSIIIPTYNRAHLIEATIESIVLQTYQNWECIVVDDGSEDSTESILNSYSSKDNRIKFFKRPENLKKGANSCRNYGFDVSSGEFINWFDSDDIMLEDFLENKIATITPQTQFVIGTGYYWFQETDRRTVLKVESTENLFLDYVMWKLEIITNSVLFKRKFLHDKELFNPSMKRGQEAEFFSRLFFDCTRSQFKVIHSADFLYRQHENSKTSKNKKYNKGYKESLFFFLFENFKRSEQIKSAELLDYFYDKLIKLFFTSNGNFHHKVTQSILNQFFPRLLKYDKLKAFEIIIFCKVMFTIKKSPYFLRNRWLKFKFNWNE